MNEEQVTKAILCWLISKKWRIVCYDFPQSGTGYFLHPNGSTEKNKNTINPDIIAVKNEICIFFENKDHFYLQDYQKLNGLITNNQYTDDIGILLSDYKIKKFYYGIGIPTIKHDRRSTEASRLVDFIVGVNADKSVAVLYSKSDEVQAAFV